jgi:hypothetical protein
VTANSTLSDLPPPQLGTWDAGTNRRATPTIASTTMARCTVFRENRIVANNNPAAPANTSSFRPGSGIGIALFGAYGDLFADNLVAGNRNIAVLALEQPSLRHRALLPAAHDSNPRRRASRRCRVDAAAHPPTRCAAAE